MKKDDFMQMLWAAPFFGGFLGFILASVFSTGQAALGIMIMLGMVAGSITLLTYTLSYRQINEEKTEKRD